MSASVGLMPAMARGGRSAAVDTKEYQRLLGESLPHVIQTQEENEYYLKMLEELDARRQHTPAEEKLAELLTLLVEEFEARHYALKPSSPLEALRELMRANRLKQKDLLDVFHTRSIVSEVIRGKRRLTVEHIRRLSQRFGVSPELFL